MKLDDDSSFDSEANQCELEKSVSEENKEFSEQNNLINDSFNNDFISKPQNTPNTENKATFATFVDKSSIVNKFLEQKSERKISLKKTDIIKNNVNNLVKSNTEMIAIKDKTKNLIQNRINNNLNDTSNKNIINNSLKQINTRTSAPNLNLSPKKIIQNVPIKILPNEVISQNSSKQIVLTPVQNNDNLISK